MEKKALVIAIKTAIRALKDQARVYVFDAYLVDKLGINDASAVHSKNRKDELEDAARKLAELIEMLDKEIEFEEILKEMRKK